ncbi:MAG: AAA family ATPase [Flavobacterium nitrogenifigens]|uniref:ATP-binding protein n=1 Tax=Flavobacterium nitrogenifigens TaxID=1617283 RepID=UPI002809A2DB|nr:AAA family ATPase [Flavobacterium nitrogenifigens]MDQ8013235.1 AAA family ATPase [Flavobacterium nitrogenifigens]
MNLSKRCFISNKLEEVFTPNTIAKLTYVKRELIEDDLEKYIKVPGKQIVVYGHSGSGKTTLLRNTLIKLEQKFIRVHCEKSTTFEDILLQAFDELNVYYVVENSISSTNKISSEIKADYKAISTKISSEISSSITEKTIKIVPPQLTPMKLAKFLGEAECVLVIEDFHKVIDTEKQRIADVIKIFIDSANEYPNVKIICIGAVGTARELIQLDSNLNSRIAELLVPLMTNFQIESIVKKGMDLLNVKMEQKLIDKIVYYSNNLASITHQMCYDICYHTGIKKMRVLKKTLKEDSFKVAVDSYVRKNSDTFSKIYDSVISNPFGWNVLKKFDFTEKEYLSFDEILRSIPRERKTLNDDLEDFLSQLGTPEYEEVIRYDRNSKKYSISSPFFRAFLKMKLALEKNEISERNRHKSRKKNKLYNIEEPKINELILSEDFLNNYYQHLDNYLIRHITLRNEIIERNLDKNNPKHKYH